MAEVVVQMTELRSLHAATSKKATKLTSDLQTPSSLSSEHLQSLIEWLVAICLQQTFEAATLSQYQASEEERWKEKEKELIAGLCPKVTSIFKMGFDGVVKQFSSHGYPAWSRSELF